MSAVSTELSGRYVLESVGDLPPLSGPRAPREASFDPTADYPARPARIVAAGTLRQYAYVAVAYCPFSYNAESGRLVHSADAVLALCYSLPAAQQTSAPFDA